MKKKRLLIFLIIVLACFLLVGLAYTGGINFFGRNNGSADNISDNSGTLTIGGFRAIQGTSILIAAVEREKAWEPNISARWFSFDYSYTVRNLIFLDANTMASYYLFDTNDNYIVGVTQFPVPSSSPVNEPIEIKWLVYEIVQQDTNSDGKINSKDKFTVSISKANGRTYFEVTKGVETIYGIDLLENNNLLLVYGADGKQWVSKIDLEEQIVMETQQLAQIPGEKTP